MNVRKAAINTVETPENNQEKYPYDTAWIDQKVEVLLSIITERIPLLGLWLTRGLMAKPEYRDYMRKLVVRFYTEMHKYCFENIKAVVRNTMTAETADFSRESIKKIVVDLESEYGAALPQMGIEPSTCIDAFVINQCRWFSSKFQFKETA